MRSFQRAILNLLRPLENTSLLCFTSLISEFLFEHCGTISYNTLLLSACETSSDL